MWSPNTVQISASNYLTIEPPNPDVITITEGDTLHLNCSSVGNPSPSYTWTLPTNSPSYSGSVLTIKSVGFEHEGQYICTVSNTVGTVTKEFNIDVQGECCQILPGKRVTEDQS
uniref:Ig-like domain-containing protein n=1 Tax=Oreochromis niloticus TaxID=8128 RepID=A0A669EBW4_ORENI